MVVGGAITLITAGFNALGLALAVRAGLPLGAQLISAAGGLATLGCRGCGTFAASLYIGTKISDWLDEQAAKRGHGNFGGWIYDAMNPGAANAAGPDVYHTSGGHAHPAGPYVRSGISRQINIRTELNLDGRKFGEALSRHQVDLLNAPQTGLSMFDGSMALHPAGGGG